MLTARAAAEALADGGHGTALVGDLLERVPPVVADQSLAEALDVLDRTESSEVPVLDADERLVGWLAHRQVVGRLRTGPAVAV